MSSGVIQAMNPLKTFASPHLPGSEQVTPSSTTLSAAMCRTAANQDDISPQPLRSAKSQSPMPSGRPYRCHARRFPGIQAHYQKDNHGGQASPRPDPGGNVLQQNSLFAEYTQRPISCETSLRKGSGKCVYQGNWEPYSTITESSLDPLPQNIGVDSAQNPDNSIR